MPAITIEVPPEQREDLHRELLTYYGVKAEAIHVSVNRHLDGDEPLDEVLRHRSELAAVDTLIDQLGWRHEPSTEPACLSAERDLLTEIARGALTGAVDDLTEALQSLRESRVDVEGLARELRRVAGLFELVQTVHTAPT